MNLRAIRLKLTGLCVFSSLSIQLVYSQGQWSWISGDSTTNRSRVYVSKGPHPNNKPGSRHGAVSWTDKAGNMGLFGGYGSESNVSPFLNDLWKYDTSTHQWNWISGDSIINQTGLYQHKTDPRKNKPGSRSDAVSWTDASGNLWLFGGFGYAANGAGFLNDLWKYDPVNNQWSSISGDSTLNNPGIYAKVGADRNNQPGSRSNAVSWIDKAGNLWLFGGYGYASENGKEGRLNDLWKYDTLTHQWSWVSGDHIINQPGIYKHSTDPKKNKPGARDEAASWADAKGNLWLFGGNDYTRGGGIGQGQLNDLWRYDTSTRQWSWISGDSIMDNPGNYRPSQTNNPASRNDAASWTDANGHFWLFGGEGYTSNRYGLLNDLWQYTPADNHWSWVSGDSAINKPGVNVPKGPHPNTKPGSRYDVVNWVDASGKMWLLGGTGYTSNGYGELSDLWKFTPCTVPDGTSSNIIVTSGQPFPLSARSNIGSTYSWSPAEGLSDPKSPTPTITTSQDVRYLITITAASGCITIDTQRVQVAKPRPGESVVAVPTAFTPNRNGVNDRLKPIPYFIKTLTYFKVFNRWGQLVFETQSLGVGWDGTLKGIPQPTETYTWILECVSTSGTTIRRSGKSVLIR